MDLRIGCAPDIPVRRFEAFLGALDERCVAVDLKVTHLPTDEQLHRLRDGDLDLGFLCDTAGPTLGDEVGRLRRGEPLAAVVGPVHRLPAREASMLGVAGDVLLVVPRHATPGLHARVVGVAECDGNPVDDVRTSRGTDARDLLLTVAPGAAATPARSGLPAPSDLGTVVAASSLDPGTWKPDAWLAWPADARPERSRVHAVAREIANQAGLYGPNGTLPSDAPPPHL